MQVLHTTEWNASCAEVICDSGMVKKNLTSLHHGIQRCRKCRLSETRTHAVPGEGPCSARIMFIGEAPGEKEDQDGRPFRGRSGSFLDELLASVGMVRDEIYVTSSVKCRPPGNRDPRPDELQTCRDAWLEQQIEILNPDLVVLLGKTALKQVLDEGGPLREVHGHLTWDCGRAILPTYHPAAGMRFPSIRRRMQQDFERIGGAVRTGHT